ncbi:hypothetical protein L3Q82_009975 [Scortum barcoo]|uniref:Uncharacterized protein n=1 Tax=Scortum barcoo TaxID=214431 RepID=A0ACB8WEF7_9TELE|nr:hypothetical protein L3Q82_009975 [Scortum barcoo]
MSDDDPRREEEIRKYSAIYGRFDSKRRDGKHLTLHELTVNEAAAQLCMRDMALLTRRDELFGLARQISREVTYKYTYRTSKSRCGDRDEPSPKRIKTEENFFDIQEALQAIHMRQEMLREQLACAKSKGEETVGRNLQMQLERLLARQMEILQDAAVQERLQALDWRIPPTALKYLNDAQNTNGAAADASRENQGEERRLTDTNTLCHFILKAQSKEASRVSNQEKTSSCGLGRVVARSLTSQTQTRRRRKKRCIIIQDLTSPPGLISFSSLSSLTHSRQLIISLFPQIPQCTYERPINLRVVSQNMQEGELPLGKQLANELKRHHNHNNNNNNTDETKTPATENGTSQRASSNTEKKTIKSEPEDSTYRLGQSGAAMRGNKPITARGLGSGLRLFLLLSHRENRYSTGKLVGICPLSSARPRRSLTTSPPDGIEMLHFRSTVALRELFHTQLKRPLAGRVRAAAAGFSTGSSDGRTPGRGKPFPGWRAPQHPARRHGVRAFCSKGDGSKDNAEKRRKVSGILPSLEDLLFYTIAEGQEKIPAHKFTTALKSTGLRTGDPRLKECMEMLKVTVKTTSDGALDRHLFKKCVQSNIVLLTQAFRKKFVIPDFQSFSAHIDELYDNAKNMSGGQVADYIPQLARFSPDLWAVALCTVDGQRHTVGDTKVPFCLQSCVKPLKYAIAVHDHGTEYVHRFIGKEPSGLRFNKLFLNEEDKPHNPMVNAGAIVCTSLIKQGASNAEKFDYVMNFMNKLAGNEYVGFSNATFQSERESGDRNFAIGYYLKEKKCFPEGTDMTSILDFYFQLCSIEVTCESASVMAATLANGGFCPITGERVLSPEAVRNTLSLMHSCGMYDFSGQFAFHVGLPAKSGVAGGILLVVPNVMGIMCWSPPLDKLGNSVRGIQFCTDLVSLCNFHNYDNLRHFAKKLDPRREGGDQRVKSVINLLFAAYTGDVSALRRFALSSMDMEQRDYDSRTALHVAAAEGHAEVVRFLLEACKVNPVPKDRWGNTPMDEAVHFGHHDVVTILRDYHTQYSPQDSSSDKQNAEKNLDGML